MSRSSRGKGAKMEMMRLRSPLAAVLPAQRRELEVRVRVLQREQLNVMQFFLRGHIGTCTHC